METQAAEPSQPTEHHTPKTKLKINKYFAAIVILAIIFVMIFYFKPAAHPPVQNVPAPQVNNTNITPPAIPLPEFNATPGLIMQNLAIPESLNDGTPLAVSFIVNNTGNESINSALITAEIDSINVYNYTLSNFEVNATQTLGFTFLKKDANYPAAGKHTLKIFINNNLSMTDTFEITATTFAPDMEIRSFTIRPQFVNIGQNVTLITYVRNIGNMDAKNASVRFFADDVLLSEQAIDLPLQTTQTLYAYWTPADIKTYTLKVIAYASGEVYTLNNEYSFNVTVTNSTS